MSTPLDSTPDDDPVLREALKRCSPSTYYAACKYRKTGCNEALRTVVNGVVERYVDRDLRSRLQTSPDQLRLAADLGLDSLTLMEIVMLAEEVFGVEVSNEELSRLNTLEDVHRFLEGKLAHHSAGKGGKRERGIRPVAPETAKMPEDTIPGDRAAGCP